jgi:hypothetical protein
MKNYRSRQLLPFSFNTFMAALVHHRQSIITHQQLQHFSSFVQVIINCRRCDDNAAFNFTLLKNSRGYNSAKKIYDCSSTLTNL